MNEQSIYTNSTSRRGRIRETKKKMKRKKDETQREKVIVLYI